MNENKTNHTEKGINTIRKTLYLSTSMMLKLDIISNKSNLKTTDLIKFILSEYIKNNNEMVIN